MFLFFILFLIKTFCENKLLILWIVSFSRLLQLHFKLNIVLLANHLTVYLIYFCWSAILIGLVTFNFILEIRKILIVIVVATLFLFGILFALEFINKIIRNLKGSVDLIGWRTSQLFILIIIIVRLRYNTINGVTCWL